jgi:uncharacterized protein (TIGR00369 family)
MGSMDEDVEVPEWAEEVIEHFLEHEHGFLSFLNMGLEAFTAEQTVLTVPFDGKLTNPTEPPSMHGGVAATLIDTVGGLALRPHLEDPVDGSMATINLDVNYLQPATDDLVATAEPIRVGGTVGVAEVTVESETPGDGVEPVAVGQGAYRLFHEGEGGD